MSPYRRVRHALPVEHRKVGSKHDSQVHFEKLKLHRQKTGRATSVSAIVSKDHLINANLHNFPCCLCV